MKIERIDQVLVIKNSKTQQVLYPIGGSLNITLGWHSCGNKIKRNLLLTVVIPSILLAFEFPLWRRQVELARPMKTISKFNHEQLNMMKFDVIRDPANHSVRRLIWFVSLITCASLVIVHVMGLVDRYRSSPTRVQLDVSHRQGIPLPAVTICPLHRFDVDRLKQLWHDVIHDLFEPSDSEEQYYQLADVLPIDELWSKITYKNISTLFPMCYVGRGNDCQSVGFFETVWTPSGTCFTYSSALNTLSGHFNGLYLRLHVGRILNKVTDIHRWKVTVHEVGVSPWLVSSRQYMQITTRYKPFTNGTRGGKLKSQYMYTRLTAKEFIRVNHQRQPCEPDNNAWSQADCEIDCFERAVTSVTGCRLPYMMASVDRVPYCNTTVSVRQTEELMALLITETRSQLLKCSCLEACTKIVYTYESESHTADYDYSRIKIFYDTALWVTVREVFVYSWVKLLCDIGNILCLLLGASVLSFFQTAEYVVDKLITAFRSMSRRF